MGRGVVFRGGVVLLIEPQAVRVLLVLHQQRLVDDGNPNALSGDPLFMEYPKPQPWVFPQFQKLPRVEILRQFVRPLGSGVEVGREKFCLHACEVPVPQVGAAEVPQPASTFGSSTRETVTAGGWRQTVPARRTSACGGAQAVSSASERHKTG